MHSLIYNLGIRFRNPRILPHLRFLRETQDWSLDHLVDRQQLLLSKLLQDAYKGSSYHRKRFSEAGVQVDNLKPLETLAKIPITEKGELLENQSEIQSELPFKKLYYSETSGSTGTPLVFYRHDDWDGFHNASVIRGYSWHDVKPWERNGYLWGFNIEPGKRRKVRALDALQNRFRMFSYDEEDIERFVKKLRKASFVGGYSSMIYRIAKAINNNPNIEPLSNLKMVKGTSEKIFPHYQIEAERAFGRRIISEYGAAEAGIIAFECPAGSMHINMETCIVELDGNDILVTNLVSNSFPIIRYRLGDSVTLGPANSCPCGMAHPTIKEVTGRIGQSIKGKSRDFPSLTLYYVFKNLAEKSILLNYAAKQTQVGRMDLKIEQKLTPHSEKLLLGEIEKYFSDEVDIHIRDSADLTVRGKKFRDFESTLPQ